jgi:hypothetical protein
MLAQVTILDKKYRRGT